MKRSITLVSTIGALLGGCASTASMPEIAATQDPWSGSTYARNLERADNARAEARRDGTLSRSEAKQLKNARETVETIGQRQAQDGLSEWEVREMENHAQVLSDLTQAQVILGPSN